MISLAALLVFPGGAGARNTKTTAIARIDTQQPPASPAGRPVLGASSAMLIDAATGKLLYASNPYRELPPASTTKIMTAILVLEHGKLDEVATISENVTKTPYTSLHLVKGEKITMRNLLYGALMRSANDSCVAMAEHIAGSEAAFAKLMNARAKQLGAKHTHFVTCNGLHDPNHYTCAADLALFARHATRFPLFNEIVHTRKWTLARSINHEDAVVFTHNRFLWRYDGADGIKTGYTKQAGKCLVGSATRGGWRLISVVMHSPDPIGEASQLLDYGFKNYQRFVIARKGQPIRKATVRWGRDEAVPVVAADILSVVVPRAGAPKVSKDLTLLEKSAPVRKGDHFGTLYATVDGRRAGATPLIAATSMGRARSFFVLFWTAAFLLLVGFIRWIRHFGRKTAKNHRRRWDRFEA